VTPYRIEFTAKARRALAAPRIPLRVIDAVIAFAHGDLARHPKRAGKPLTGSMEGRWTARRGSYRIIYEIDDDNRVIRIIGMAHRDDIYRTR